MADTEVKETVAVSSPEKVVEEEKKEVTKEESVKEVKEVEEVKEVDENSKTSENGDTKEASKTNGTSEETETKEKEAESTNGNSTVSSDSCCIKRKSTGANVSDETDSKDVISPAKKAKVEAEKPAEEAVETETNGDA